MTRHNIICAVATAFVMISCGQPSVPDSYSKKDAEPHIFPDYTNVTIPSNIAPVNFTVQEDASEAVARFTYPGGEKVYGEKNNIVIDEDEWKDILAAAKGKDIKVDVFTAKNGKWTSYKTFTISVAEEEIDPYVSYRLIQPSYVAYESLYIEQRNITNYENDDIYSNMLVQTEQDGQCINCHSYQNYKTDHMLFHMRQSFGGTMIVNGDKIEKVDLKTEETISAGVYPAWHPTLNIIAFSTNKTGQSFHTKDVAKIEVQDTESDLILYDVDKNEVSYIENAEDELEIFPTWSADGKTLYFCSANFHYYGTNNVSDTTNLDTVRVKKETEMIQRYKECKYDVYKKSFNLDTRTFGKRELVYSATQNDKSATLPRVSPDGRYIAFAEGNWGCFHIWHPEADIKIIDLKTGETVDTKAMNSERAESYPVWSSNGRWLMCESRRDDGNYTRPYIAYFDKKGKVHKSFEMPQKNPNFYTYQLRSFNRPEFMKEPVKVTPHEFASVAKTEAKKAIFKK